MVNIIMGCTMMSVMDGSDKYDSGLIGSIQFLDSVLELLHQKREIGVTEAAKELKRPKSTVHTYLKTLENINMVDNDHGRYSLSLRLLEFGGQVRDQNELFKVARPEIEELASEVDELINIWIRHGDYVVRAYNSKERYGIKNLAILGERIYLHQNTAGKAILAKLPRPTVEEYATRTGLPSAMEKTVSSYSELMSELEEIREDGFAVAKGERFEGTRAISASIHDEQRDEIGALSIVIPGVSSKADDLEEKYSDIIVRKASDITLKMKYKNTPG